MSHAVGTRNLIAYRYTNTHLNNRFREGILYHESENNMIVWQCADKVTPWHGELKMENFGPGLDYLMLRFEASYDGSRMPNLHSSVMFRTHPETYEGYDYRGRFVQMYPITKWTYDADSDAWKHYADWTTATHEWVLVVEDSSE